jgi:hypothetical protein
MHSQFLIESGESSSYDERLTQEPTFAPHMLQKAEPFRYKEGKKVEGMDTGIMIEVSGRA